MNNTKFANKHASSEKEAKEAKINRDISPSPSEEETYEDQGWKKGEEKAPKTPKKAKKGQYNESASKSNEKDSSKKRPVKLDFESDEEMEEDETGTKLSKAKRFRFDATSNDFVEEEEEEEEDFSHDESEEEQHGLNSIREGFSKGPQNQPGQFTTVKKYIFDKIPTLGSTKNDASSAPSFKIEFAKNKYVVVKPHHVVDAKKPYSFQSLTLMNDGHVPFSYVCKIEVLDGLQKALAKADEIIKNPKKLEKILQKASDAPSENSK